MTAATAAARTFSDSWHRVSGVRASLRPNLRAHRQMFRGETWVVLQEPLSNEFFRIPLDAYHFLSRLGPHRTVDEVWREGLERDGDHAFSQEEVVQLLAQLNHSNLLLFDTPGIADSLFERFRKRRRRETKAQLLGFLAIKIPLLDPDRMLDHAMPLIRLLYGKVGLVLWSLLMLAAGKVLIDNADRLFDQAQGVLAPSNLVLLYVGFLVAKLVHEFSHAAACKRFGGEVHVMGVMLLLFTPLPYVDATACWGFRQRWQRLLVCAAGMLAEFVIAGIAALVWANSAPGVVNALAYNIIFTTTVSTLAFNLNPLLRFDGYYMLVDLLGTLNLYQRSREQLRHSAEKLLFGLRDGRAPADDKGEAVTLGVYGVLSLGYWAIVAVGILTFITDHYLDLGLLLGLFLAFLWGVLPLVMFGKWLLFSPRLYQRRGRAVLVTLGLLAAVLLPLALLPVPDRVRVPGVVESEAIRQANNPTEGFLDSVLVRSGDRVAAGQPLMRLRNPDLDAEIAAAEAERRQLLAEERRAEGSVVADLQPLREHRAAVEARLAELEQRRAALLVAAPIAGTWTDSEAVRNPGRWLPRGTLLGMVVDNGSHRFVAVVPQVATYLFDDEIEKAEIRLAGQEDVNLVASRVQVIPFQHGLLPSAALGWMGGGDIAVSMTEGSGRLAVEPFFRIHALFGDHGNGGGEAGHLRHGQSGTMRLTLRDLPLLWQWERQIRQFFQRKPQS